MHVLLPVSASGVSRLAHLYGLQVITLLVFLSAIILSHARRSAKSSSSSSAIAPISHKPSKRSKRRRASRSLNTANPDADRCIETSTTEDGLLPLGIAGSSSSSSTPHTPSSSPVDKLSAAFKAFTQSRENLHDAPMAKPKPRNQCHPSPVALPTLPPPVTSISHGPSLHQRQQKELVVLESKVKQPYDAFLVLDVEATCVQGSDFDWPNEIIEWPVVLLKWSDKDAEGRANTLVVVDEFRSFVRPTWRPQLSDFCTLLTGITQGDVDSAPTFTTMLDSFAAFLARNGLIDPHTGARLQRFAFGTDGPFDVRDFVAKQCFISKIPTPGYLQGDVLDVRRAVGAWVASSAAPPPALSIPEPVPTYQHPVMPPKRVSLNIPLQLRALSLAPFAGRQHSGIDDARNIARILTELGRRNISLEPNLCIRPNRRWYWMGKSGEIRLP